MAGTKAGGKKAAETNRRIHGNDFYATIGAKGGRLGRTGGFAQKTPCTCDVIRGAHTRPQCRGKLGGYKSRR